MNVLVCLGNEQELVEGTWQGGGRAEVVLFG